MTLCRWCGAFTAAAVVVAGLSAAFVSQDKKPEAPKPQDPKDKGAQEKPMSKEQADMMAKWTVFMTPGAEHKVLDFKVGKWTLQGKMWMDPNAPPQPITGTSEMKWMMGGRYLEDNTKGDPMPGMGPFEGMGLSGYDNMRKKYVATWVDNMGTGVMFMEGTYDPAKKTLTWKGEGPDMHTGKYAPMRTVESLADKDKWMFESYGPGPDGKEMKGMEMTYTRVK